MGSAGSISNKPSFCAASVLAYALRAVGGRGRRKLCQMDQGILFGRGKTLRRQAARQGAPGLLLKCEGTSSLLQGTGFYSGDSEGNWTFAF